jgi:hypothetical protein
MRLLALLLVATVACSPGSRPAEVVRTPEQVLADAHVGSTYTVRGRVFAVTFDNVHDPAQDPNGGYTPKAPRWVLLRTEIPDGVQSTGEFRTDDATARIAWGLGLRFESSVDLPQVGDEVEATGKLIEDIWDPGDGPTPTTPPPNAKTRPVLSPLTAFRIVSTPLVQKSAGAACSADMECGDQLICERATRKCAPPPPHLDWGSEWHDINGACSTDDDCPLGQVCDLTYAMSTTAGVYSVHYASDRDSGRHLCVVDPQLTQAQLCPRPVPTEDLASGRFTLGKEICVVGSMLLETVPEDGDTHDEIQVTDPLVYPLGSAPVWFFGAVSENSPSYKDPARPSGALADPAIHQQVVMIGTYRYDPGHGWFEVHPIKKWWPVP